MNAREIVHLAPDRANLVTCTTVETPALVEDKITHSLFLLSVIVALYEKELLCILFLFSLCSRLRKRSDEIVLYGLETVGTLLLRLGSLSQFIAFFVAEVVNRSLESLVLYIVRIISLVNVGSQLVRQCFLISS